MSITRRSLQQRAVAELRRQATELGLAATGRKSTLVHRIYCAMRPTAQQQPQQPRGKTPLPQGTTAPTSDLAATVQELVEQSLQKGRESPLTTIASPTATRHRQHFPAIAGADSAPAVPPARRHRAPARRHHAPARPTRSR